MHAFEFTLQKLSNLKAIPHVRHVEFSWIPPLKAERQQPSSADSLLVDGQKFGDTEIMVTFTEDDPFQIKDKDLLKQTANFLSNYNQASATMILEALLQNTTL